MRTSVIAVALLTLVMVVVAAALPPQSETRGIAGKLPLHTLFDPNAVDACARLIQGNGIK